jgi:hypothetical protein
MVRRNFKVLLFIIGGWVLVYYVSDDKINLWVCSGLLLIISISFFQNIFQYFKTRKGIFSTGTIINDSKPESEWGRKDYPVKVEFLSPVDNQTYFISHEISGLSKKPYKKEVKVWINKKNIQKSIVVEKFDQYWFLNMVQLVIFGAVLIVLLVINIIR